MTTLFSVLQDLLPDTEYVIEMFILPQDGAKIPLHKARFKTTGQYSLYIKFHSRSKNVSNDYTRDPRSISVPENHTK